MRASLAFASNDKEAALEEMRDTFRSVGMNETEIDETLQVVGFLMDKPGAMEGKPFEVDIEEIFRALNNVDDS